MSFKRRVLSALGKDVLVEIGRGLELDVTTRMGLEELRDALAKSKRAKLDAIVQESLSRDTLKDICGAVGSARARQSRTSSSGCPSRSTEARRALDDIRNQPPGSRFRTDVERIVGEIEESPAD
jgi:hypothetical protein